MEKSIRSFHYRLLFSILLVTDIIFSIFYDYNGTHNNKDLFAYIFMGLVLAAIFVLGVKKNEDRLFVRNHEIKWMYMGVILSCIALILSVYVNVYHLWIAGCIIISAMYSIYLGAAGVVMFLCIYCTSNCINLSQFLFYLILGIILCSLTAFYPGNDSKKKVVYFYLYSVITGVCCHIALFIITNNMDFSLLMSSESYTMILYTWILVTFLCLFMNKYVKEAVKSNNVITVEEQTNTGSNAIAVEEQTITDNNNTETKEDETDSDSSDNNNADMNDSEKKISDNNTKNNKSGNRNYNKNNKNNRKKNRNRNRNKSKANNTVNNSDIKDNKKSEAAEEINDPAKTDSAEHEEKNDASEKISSAKNNGSADNKDENYKDTNNKDINNKLSNNDKDNIAEDKTDIVEEDHSLIERFEKEKSSLYKYNSVIATIAGRAAGVIGADKEKTYLGVLYAEIGKLVDSKNYIEEGVRLVEEKKLPDYYSNVIRSHLLKPDIPESKEAAIVYMTFMLMSLKKVFKAKGKDVDMVVVVEKILWQGIKNGSFEKSELDMSEFQKLTDYYMEYFKAKG